MASVELRLTDEANGGSVWIMAREIKNRHIVFKQNNMLFENDVHFQCILGEGY